MPGSRQSRRWCFTVNNPTREELAAFSQISDTAEQHQIVHCVVGREVGANGTPHLQGYVEFLNRKRMGGVKRIVMFGRSHLEPARGTPEQAGGYCRKDGSIVCDYGQPIRQGERTDLTAAIETLRRDGLDRMIDEYPETYVKYTKGLRELRAHLIKKSGDFRKREMPKVHIFWGPTGTGKSRTAYERYPDSFVWSRPQNTHPYAYGYDGEKDIIIDEFYGWLPYDLVLRLTDRYPVYVNAHGVTVPWMARNIVFTSNLNPNTWWEKTIPNLKAFARRVDSIVHFESASTRSIHSEESEVLDRLTRTPTSGNYLRPRRN